ncbi:MAG: P-loop NTPase fold protein [Myxococcota bacterium]|nr:P-loop NTPase fold protein [Myxococcota bacterium]
MWSDNDTRDDYLNFRCVAETAAELIVQANGLPLSMGVSGGWGVGKSSMLNLISDALENRDEGKKYLFLSFNAWLYQGYDDARAALLEEIATKLVERAAGNQTALTKARKLLGRVSWLRLAGLTSGSALALAAGVPPVGLIGAAWAAVQGMTDGNITKKDVAALDKSGQAVAKAGANVIKPVKEETPPQQIHALREHFQETLAEMNTTLVVFIDDLDRCLPATAVSTLEAVRLFLFLPRTAFVIAADDKMIRQAVRVHFKDVALDDDLVTSYFDKLIQIPLRVPPLGTQEVRAYLMLLYLKKAGLGDERTEEIRSKVCERLSASWSGKRVDFNFVTGIVPDIDSEVRANLELADRLAPLMTTAQQISGNPRLIKRFLNTLWVRLAVAKSQRVAVDESTLAKVLLFERCAAETAYQRLVAAVNDGNEGRPAFLADWERQARSGEEVTGLERDWNTPFVRDWLALEPALGELDLRAVVYVSRETLPIVTAADQLSTAALELLEGLLKLTAASSAFTDRLQALPGRDHALMVDRLMVRARQEQSWGKPNVLWAFLALIEAAPEMAPQFGKFLMELSPTRLTAPIVPILGDKEWARAARDAWLKSAETPGPVRKALKALAEKGA